MKKYYQILTILGLIVLATVLRLSLGVASPTPFGYVYDFYHEPMVMYYTEGELPGSNDCWQCYHPPFYTLVGYGIYSIGMSVSGGDQEAALRGLAWFSTFTSFVFMLFCYLIVRRFITHKPHLTLLMALLVSLPCLLLSSFSVEGDLFCATLMVMALFFYLRYAASQHVWVSLILMAICSGLAAGTKYAGLVICIVLALLMGYAVIRRRSKLLLAHLVVYFCITAALGGWRYIDNYRNYGHLIVGNYGQHGQSQLLLNKYEFHTFRLKKIIHLMSPDSPDKELKRFSAYDSSVFSSLYGQLWTDCSIFSNPSRHGLSKGLYPTKKIPVYLIVAVLMAGLLPVLLSGAGTVTAVRHFSKNRALLLFSLVALGIYTRWFLGGPEWMLKTKYLTYLAPVGLVFCGYGLDLARRTNKSLETGLISLLWITVAVASAYGLVFALT